MKGWAVWKSGCGVPQFYPFQSGVYEKKRGWGDDRYVVSEVKNVHLLRIEEHVRAQVLLTFVCVVQ